VQSFAPAAVFLNSRYYGFAWLKESLCEGYLVQTYGGTKENYEILRRSEWGNIGNERGVNDWARIMDMASEAVESGNGFLDDAVFAKFCELVDIDNFMLYFAIQTYIDNHDWPQNNMKMWRYFAEENEVITNDFNDGKWRFLMYDIEFALGIYGNGHEVNTLGGVLGLRRRPMGEPSVLLQAVLQRSDMQEYFANTISDLLSGPYSFANANAVLDEITLLRNPELFNAMSEGVINLWDVFNEHLSDFLRRRPQTFLNNMAAIFDIPDVNDIFTVSFTGAEGADAWINTRKATGAENIRGWYITHYSVPLKFSLYAGYEFASWEINGTHYYDADMRIDASMVDAGNVVAIRLHTTALTDGIPLIISTVNISNTAGRIELYNPNQVAISTRDYFLSDDSANLRRWKIPNITIQPGETLIIAASNNQSADILMRPQTNFRLREGETLYLSDRNDKILGVVNIPELEKNETLVRTEDGGYIIIAEE
jgi:hypothetical protein